MKKHQGICMLIFLTIVGCGVLFGFFVLHNPNASVPYADIFSPVSEIRHRELTTTAPSNELININTATAEQLQMLPGIGPGLAQRILDYREENGPFSAVAELSNVPGIGTNRLEELLGHITTGG